MQTPDPTPDPADAADRATDGTENGTPPADSVPAAPPLSREERRERAVCDALRAFVRDHALVHFGSKHPDGRRLPIVLRCAADTENGWEMVFSPPLGEQVHAQLAEALAERDVYRRGHVYCFRCRSSSCPHSRSPDTLAVFRGYTETGLPEWSDLVQVFIECRDERVDRLYADPPHVLARVQLGRELRARQLTPFGRASRSYEILGQVVAGYFTARRRAVDAAGARLAATLQVVIIRGADGSPRLKLNLLLGGLAPDEADEALCRDFPSTLGRGVEEASHALAGLEREMLGPRNGAGQAELGGRLGRIPRILHALSRTLEQSARQGLRRTLHADRHDRQERPVHMAVQDARAAADGELFYDEKRGTWIVAARRGRAHAFSQEGRHVTSFPLPPGAADFRVRTNRWRPMDAAERTAFRRRVGESS